jgi:hypothetical protein
MIEFIVTTVVIAAVVVAGIVVYADGRKSKYL